MNESTRSVNVGIAGSLTMIVLTLAVTLLCISFYRRYKRAQGVEDSSKESENQ